MQRGYIHAFHIQGKNGDDFNFVSKTWQDAWDKYDNDDYDDIDDEEDDNVSSFGIPFDDDSYAKGGGVGFKPYGNTKGKFKITYIADGKKQSEIRETLEMAIDTANRYKKYDEFSKIEVFDESGKKIMADGGFMTDVYAKGGATKTFEYVPYKFIYRELDDEDAEQVIFTPEEAEEFIQDWNRDMETDYEDWQDFNKGEEYRELEAIMIKQRKFADGGFMNNVYAKGGGVDNELYIYLTSAEDDEEHLVYALYDKNDKIIESNFEDIKSAKDWAKEKGYNAIQYADGGMFEENDGFMKADNEFNYRYPEKEVYIETLDEPIDLTSTVTIKSNEVVISPIDENIDLNDDNRVRARMTQSSRGTAENFGKINPRAFEFIDLPMPTSHTHKND
jgi:hypothetical protein